MRKCLIVLLTFMMISVINGAKDDDNRKYRPTRRMDRGPKDDKWKEKDVLNYNEGDLENLYEQWEVSLYKVVSLCLCGPL